MLRAGRAALLPDARRDTNRCPVTRACPIRAGSDQQAHALGETVDGRRNQRCVTVPRLRPIHVGTACEENLDARSVRGWGRARARIYICTAGVDEECVAG